VRENLREYCEEDEVYNGVDKTPGDVEDGEKECGEEIESVVILQTQHHQPVAAHIEQAPDQTEDSKSLKENVDDITGIK